MSYKFGPILDDHRWTDRNGGLQKIERYQSLDDIYVVLTFGDGSQFKMEITEFASYKNFKREFLRQMSFVIKGTHSVSPDNWENVVQEILNATPEIVMEDPMTELMEEIMAGFQNAGMKERGKAEAEMVPKERADSQNIIRYEEVEGGIIFSLTKLEAYCHEHGYSVSRNTIREQLKAGGGKRQRHGGANRNNRVWFWPCETGGSNE